ncbi:hypothetical protein HA402_014116 [Bradysia odoriphaga]|nr:hypothetical protein HA402_014116 [Bradysia odoriphaga]
MLPKQAKHTRSQQQYVNTMMIHEMYPDCLTIDDLILAEEGLPLKQYDALLLFAPADNGFATRMIKKIESFGFKLCVKERDFLGGPSFDHEKIRNLLTKRCDRLVVILSPDFLSNSLNKFTSDLAQSLSISQGKRKLIPCIYKPYQLPEMFRGIHVLDYEKSKIFNNFWEKLKMSLQTTSEERIACPLNSVTDLDQLSIRSSSQPNTDSVRLHGSFNRNASLQITSLSNSLLPASEERLAYQCPPNSIISTDQTSLSEDLPRWTHSSFRFYGSFNRSTSEQLNSSSDSSLASSEEQFAYECPPNSVTVQESGQSSSDQSLRSYDSFRRMSYPCPPNSDQMSLKENTPHSTDTSIRLQQLISTSDSLDSRLSSLRSFGGSAYECLSNSVTGCDQMIIPEDLQSSTNSSIQSHRRP